jgi:hypothetical protein
MVGLSCEAAVAQCGLAGPIRESSGAALHIFYQSITAVYYKKGSAEHGSPWLTPCLLRSAGKEGCTSTSCGAAVLC